MIEDYILSTLIQDEEFTRKTLPFLKKDYFPDEGRKVVFELIKKFVEKYNKVPNKAVLDIDLSETKGINQTTYDSAKECIDKLEIVVDVNPEWLLANTERFCQDKAIYNAIMDSIKIMEDKKDHQSSRGAIPKLLSDALAVSFDQLIGHDFIEDSEIRFDNYHKKERRIAFDLDYFNKITKGGLTKKTLNIIMGGTGVGKSLVMCHMAAGNLTAGLNVLYITMEMAEEKIAERIDANLLDVSLDDLITLTKDAYTKKMARVKSKTVGRLIIKEYPTASAGSANFRHLINELKLKRNFKPDIVYIDYLNICSSSRLKSGKDNSYTYVKAIAEELRGLGVEFDVPVVSATQTNRTGFTSSDVGLEDTSESFGLPATADFMVALIVTEELEKLNQIMVKQLKNRYSDPTKYKRFVIGVDKNKMKLYDVEYNAQSNIMDAPGSSYSTEFTPSSNQKFGKFDFGS